jgi:uncharacterized membrane protein
MAYLALGLVDRSPPSVSVRAKPSPRRRVKIGARARWHGNRLFLPALIIPAVALGGTLLAKQTTLGVRCSSILPRRRWFP